MGAWPGGRRRLARCRGDVRAICLLLLGGQPSAGILVAASPVELKE